MDTAIILCSRLDSRRIPRKAMALINGQPLIWHLIKRLERTGLPIIVAVPAEELDVYTQELYHLRSTKAVIFGGDQCPLRRMADIAVNLDLTNVVRICHDKIFVEPATIRQALSEFKMGGLQYLYSSKITPGAGFEIIRRDVLEAADKAFKDVEHISYAVRAVAQTVRDWKPQSIHMTDYCTKHRLLIDYPEDLIVMEAILKLAGPNASLAETLRVVNANPWLASINRQPRITVYTCAYNAEAWIEKAIASVEMQRGFQHECEYILVDDFSDDKTYALMARKASYISNIRLIRNQRNLGLASSCNVALSQARGEYIIRLDADDYFTDSNALTELSYFLEARDLDGVYPANYFGSFDRVQSGNEQHHMGGAMFVTRALNHLKFMDGLRGLEGYEFFRRAHKVLNIGYLERPLFFYTQRTDSLSNTNTEERVRLKARIDEGRPLLAADGSEC